MNAVLGGYESGKDSVRAYLDSQKVGGIPGVLLDQGIRSTEIVFNMTTSVLDSAINAGRGVGNSAWAASSSVQALIDYNSGKISESEKDAILSNAQTTTKSTAIGQYSGMFDFGFGMLTGIAGAVEYNYLGTSSINTGSSTIINAKDNFLIQNLNLNRDNYMQGKDITNTAGTVTMLGIALGEVQAAHGAKVKAGQTTTQTTTSGRASLTFDEALQKLNDSSLRPGQTEISRSRVQAIVDNYDPMIAQSSIYTDSSGRYVVEGHHTTIANTMLERGTEINMGATTTQAPSAMNIYWTKQWYEFWKTAIKVTD